MPVTYKTLTYSESTSGWTSFWDYTPSFSFSINGDFYTTKDGSIWKHYNILETKNHGLYYGEFYDASVDVVINDNPSFPKVFKTVNYEGSNGWEMTSMETESFSPSSNEYGNESINDSTLSLKSYSEGKYIERGVQYNSGFNRKENKYYANVKANGVINRREGEVISSTDTSGVKGVYVTIKLKTDETTDEGGNKRLFSVSSEYVQSS